MWQELKFLVVYQNISVLNSSVFLFLILPSHLISPISDMTLFNTVNLKVVVKDKNIIIHNINVILQMILIMLSS